MVKSFEIWQTGWGQSPGYLNQVSVSTSSTLTPPISHSWRYVWNFWTACLIFKNQEAVDFLDQATFNASISSILDFTPYWTFSQKKVFKGHNFCPVFSEIGTDVKTKSHKSFHMDFWVLKLFTHHSKSMLLANWPTKTWSHRWTAPYCSKTNIGKWTWDPNLTSRRCSNKQTCIFASTC